MKYKAMEEISMRLEEYGLSEHEITCLLARFLEEEAQNYIDAMNLVRTKEKALN